MDDKLWIQATKEARKDYKGTWIWFFFWNRKRIITDYYVKLVNKPKPSDVESLSKVFLEIIKDKSNIQALGTLIASVTAAIAASLPILVPAIAPLFDSSPKIEEKRPVTPKDGENRSSIRVGVTDGKMGSSP